MHLTILLPQFLHWQPGTTFLALKFGVDVISYLFTAPYYKQEEVPEGFI